MAKMSGLDTDGHLPYGGTASAASFLPRRFYEPDWRSGKAVPTRIARADDLPMGIAGW
jgi:hypothetical protein